MPTEKQNSLIQPVPVERDAYGFWTHPDYPEWDESTLLSTVNDWFEGQGLERATVLFEYDAPQDLQDDYLENGEPDYSKWQPTPPQGDGWFMLSIFDTEDGPVCIWGRREASA